MNAKNTSLSLLLIFLCIGCGQEAPQKSAEIQHEYAITGDNLQLSETTELTSVDDSTTFSFGNITAGDTVKHIFRFKNTGKLPLIISSATATCGCTVAKFNKRPIAPGNIDSITAVFASSKENKGFANKVITVSYNSPKSPKLFTLYGRVL